MEQNVLKKVTVFVIREKNGKKQVLLFQHPSAGIQIPAGTVEVGENTLEAAIREMKEETGITTFDKIECVGKENTRLEKNYAMIFTRPIAYSRPDKDSFDWCTFRRGIKVTVNRKSENGFTLVSYKEFDDFYNPTYITYEVTGWVTDDSLAYNMSRDFYMVSTSSCMEDSWEKFTDNHTFRLFWADIDNLPMIVTPQDQWIKHLIKTVNNE